MKILLSLFIGNDLTRSLRRLRRLRQFAFGL
jgi:hypothetical protein